MICQQMFVSHLRTVQVRNGNVIFQILSCCNRQPVSAVTFKRSTILPTVATRAYFSKCIQCSSGQLNRSLCHRIGGMSCLHNKDNSRLLTSSFHTSPAKTEWPMHLTSAFDMKMTDYWKNQSGCRQLRTNSSTSEQKTSGTLCNVRNLTLSAKGLVEASPVSLQPYLRLIRLDRPIGRITLTASLDACLYHSLVNICLFQFLEWKYVAIWLQSFSVCCLQLNICLM